MDADARRARILVEESREAVIVIDEADTVLLASRRARQSIEGIGEGERVPAGVLSGEVGLVPLVVPYELGGRRERIVYLSQAGDMTAYEELRTGFTAAVSHELRTPLARLLSLLEMATLPDEDIELEIRPRMLRVIGENLTENAIRYAGPGASFTLAVERDGNSIVLRGTDDGVGVREEELSRLFERFYRADHARASRGTGLGLAIVKHIVGQAGGTVEASGDKGAGLEIRCVLPRRSG
ncbi:MAG: hypothetical protein EXQ81_10685 [Thermoleophilia bacterium]|nr:hypothetical protein [Thermoleophilia bacterium]